MEQWVKRNSKTAVILTFILFLAIPSSALAQTADIYFQQGKEDLEDGLLTEASANFQQALGLDPNHEGANLFYAVTRLAMISQTAAFNTLLDRSGVSATGRNVFNWTADFTRDPNGKILLPSNAPTGGEFQSYLKTDILPEVNAALNNLSKVGSAYQTTFLWLTAAGTGTVSSPNTLTDSTQSWINNEFGGFKVVVADIEYTIVSNTANTITVTPDFSVSPGSYGYRIFEPIHIDYGDVLVIKGGLTLVKAGIYVVTAYNLDVDIDTLLPLYYAATLNIQNDLINAYSQILTLLPDQQLPQAKPILKEAIALLTAAIDYIVAETGPQDRELFVIDDPTLEREFRSVLSALDISLDRSAYILVTYVNLSEFFDNPKNLRGYLPKFTKMSIQANTFSDPTFGGILPGMTTQTINEGLWNWILYPESLSWTRVDPPLVSSSWGLRGVHLTSSNEGWAVGRDYTNSRGVLLHYLNSSWTSVTPPSVSANWELRAVYFTSSNEGWAVGYDSTNHRGVLLRYLNGSWTSVTPPSVTSSWALNAVHFTSPNEGWAIGDAYDGGNRRGVLLHYLNGSWTSVAPPPVSSYWDLKGVHFISPSEGWAVGDDWSSSMGVFLHYSNGIWTPVTFPGSTYLPFDLFTDRNYLSAVGFTSPESGWGVGGSDNDGNNLFQYSEGRWMRIKKPSHGPDNLTSIHFPTPNEGWAVGSGEEVLLHYSGGAWTSIKLLGLNKSESQVYSMPYFTSIHFASPYEGWVVGENWFTGQGVLVKYSAPGIYVGQDGLCGGKNTCYTSIQNGIDAAQSNGIIAMTQETYYEDVILDDPKVLIVKGGWDTSFTSCSSYTTIQGSITITNGTMIVENIIVK
jgi:photosystem II stability/assembly factor-like uncharacterized protein